MKIEIEIPDWAVGKPIYVTTNKELIAYTEPFDTHNAGEHKLEYGSLKVKIERCNGCGYCCSDCIFLKSDGCGFGPNIPHKCLISDCSWMREECSERFKEI